MLPSKDELKRRVCSAIDEQSQRTIGVSKHIMSNPEIGFQEVKTSAYVQQQFEMMGLATRSRLARTGVKTRLKSLGAPPGHRQSRSNR